MTDTSSSPRHRIGLWTHTTAVVVVPPEDVWEPIQAIRRLYDRKFRRWMPHITLIYPFRPREEFEEIAPAIEAAVADLTPFETILRNFRFFEHSPISCTVWLEPEPGNLFHALYGRLLTACGEALSMRPAAPPGFTPHLSLGQAKGPEAARALIATFREGWRTLRFTVSEVCLIWRSARPDDVFRIARRIRLGTPAVSDNREPQERPSSSG